MNQPSFIVVGINPLGTLDVEFRDLIDLSAYENPESELVDIAKARKTVNIARNDDGSLNIEETNARCKSQLMGCVNRAANLLAAYNSKQVSQDFTQLLTESEALGSLTGKLEPKPEPVEPILKASDTASDNTEESETLSKSSRT